MRAREDYKANTTLALEIVRTTDTPGMITCSIDTDEKPCRLITTVAKNHIPEDNGNNHRTGDNQQLGAGMKAKNGVVVWMLGKKAASETY